MKTILMMCAFLATAPCVVAETDEVKVEAEAEEKQVIAVVLGKKITVDQKEHLDGIIFRKLLEQFAEENQIKPTEAELDAFVHGMEEQEKEQRIKMEQLLERLKKELEDGNLSEDERKKKQAEVESIEESFKMTDGSDALMRMMTRQMGQQFVQSWKVNQALHAKYGGRVLFQQAGLEPIDAYRDFLKEKEKEGAFEIINKQYEAEFWDYFVNQPSHFLTPEEEGKKMMETPWWEKKKSDDDESEEPGEN